MDTSTHHHPPVVKRPDATGPVFVDLSLFEIELTPQEARTFANDLLAALRVERTSCSSSV